MTTGLLTIGSSALDAAYVALRTTGNNIANVNTPGYSREVVTFQPQVQTGVGNMYLGNGVSATDVSRQYSNFLGQQNNLAQATASQADTTATLTNQINSLFANNTTGLGAAIDNLFQQLQTLSTQPSNSSAQQTSLAAAQNMTGRFNDTYAQLQNMTQAADAQMQQEINTVNTTVNQIAQLNQQISLASVGGQSPNSLLDQRDQYVQSLNKSIGVTTSTESNGAIDVYLANGEPLLVGSQVSKLTMGSDPTNPQNVVVGTSNGSAIAALSSSQPAGGAIGALLQFRNVTVPGVQNRIGQLAVSLSAQFNAIQAAGVTSTGASGTPLFSSPTVAVTAATSNSDSSSVTLGATYANTAQVQASSYQLQVENGNYVVTRGSDGKTTTFASQPIQIDGMTLSFNKTPANGDVFNIAPVQNGANSLRVMLSSGAQIAVASPIQAKPGSSNTGSLGVADLSLQALPANPDPNLQQPVTLTFTGAGTFTVSGNGAPSGTQAYTAGQPININGWSLTLNGTPATGDTVSVSASGANSGDNRNVLLMTQLQGQGVVAGNTYDQAYANVVGAVGTLASTAQTNQTSQDAILSQTQSALSSVSGVNLDEEASSLMHYQQQYQAAAQLINSATQIFNSLMTVINAA